MKVFSAYANGWLSLWKYRWPIAFLYLVNITFTFVVSTPFTSYFKEKMEKADFLDSDGFDISAVLEFFTNYGDGLRPLVTLLAIVILFFYFFSVYASAGILYAVASKNAHISLRAFWTGGLNYFWKILRLSVYFLISVLMAVSLVVFLLLSLGINILEVADDNEIILKLTYGIVALFILVSIFVLIRQYSKIFIAIHNQPFITSAILSSGKFTFRYFGATVLLFLVNVAVLITIGFLLIKLKSAINQNLWIVTFIIAQALLIAKISLRIVHLHSCFELYLSIKSPETFSDH